MTTYGLLTIGQAGRATSQSRLQIRAKLAAADLQAPDLGQAALGRATLVNADLTGANLGGAPLTKLLDARFNIRAVAQRQGHGPQVLAKHHSKRHRSAKPNGSRTPRPSRAQGATTDGPRRRRPVTLNWACPAWLRSRVA